MWIHSSRVAISLNILGRQEGWEMVVILSDAKDLSGIHSYGDSSGAAFPQNEPSERLFVALQRIHLNEFDQDTVGCFSAHDVCGVRSDYGFGDKFYSFGT